MRLGMHKWGRYRSFGCKRTWLFISREQGMFWWLICRNKVYLYQWQKRKQEIIGNNGIYQLLKGENVKCNGSRKHALPPPPPGGALIGPLTVSSQMRRVKTRVNRRSLIGSGSKPDFNISFISSCFDDVSETSAKAWGRRIFLHLPMLPITLLVSMVFPRLTIYLPLFLPRA